MSIESVMASNHLILCYLLLFLLSIFSSIKVFSNELDLHIRWPKYWSFSFSISPSNEQSVLMNFRINWFDLLAVQGALKSLLQYHSSKASILQCLAFFTVQLPHPYIHVEHLCTCLLALFYVFFGETVFQIFCPFFDWIVFLILSCLYILEVNPLSIASFANVISHSEGYLFILLMGSFAVQKLLS